MSDATPASASAASALRAALSACCGDESPPGAWRLAAECAGVSGADAFLCHLSRSVIGALERLAASTQAGRAKLRSLHEAARADSNSHWNELETRLETAEASKRTALERELCAVDAALELLRVERRAAADAIASLGDAELFERHAELTARLSAVDSQLLALPTAVVEPPHVSLIVDMPALLAGAAVFGRVAAPRAVTAPDLALEGAPASAYPGWTLLLHLVIQSAHLASQSAEELEVSLDATAAATQVEASLCSAGVAPLILPAFVCADVPGRGITVSIAIPSVAPVGSSVCFGPFTVFGQPMRTQLASLRVEPPGPADLSPEDAAWLQTRLPPGGSHHPGEWKEVYRATTHGFDAAAFHERCDGRARLLVLVRAREGGWLFGGFTAVGFSAPPDGFGYIADPAALLFSLTNSLGRPEKLESKQTGKDLYYSPSISATFGPYPFDLHVGDNADTDTSSHTNAGCAFAESASTGAHPMARDMQHGWCAAEVVAWVV